MTKPSRPVQTVMAGGFRTAYVEAGDPQRDTVVLIHDGGFGTTAELCWGPVIDALSADFHVVAPELLGWGGTDKAVFLDRSPYAARIVHVAAFCQALGIDRAHFVGASFGGSLLLRALVEPGRPWPVDRAVSISGTGGPFRVPEGIAALADYEPSLEAAEKMTRLIVRSTEGLDDHIRRRHENSLIPGHWESLMAPRLSNPAVQRQLPPDTFLDRMRELETPLLLVEGRYDTLLETGWSKKLTDLAPGATSVEVDYSHEPNIEAPEETSRMIAEFLQKKAV
ncbi:alpha/beta hydrolase [Streptosporangium sp. NBC_01755]|uniref:alpha/beta fold hydrolase n=1 Tax=unclassified Streptosporangium TaxID=2632669 RepID=UPI002DD90C00|nr:MULTISPECIES: alpha/beta hydrolase [unclassified Streptosporangium]WSA25610.1 alpha/beta hydrolase [Streptosporangium sp. NBC_01810]WSD03002.1 alpha/beta hydrolase [Streptosporangium sp. NBC_01755]